MYGEWNDLGTHHDPHTKGSLKFSIAVGDYGLSVRYDSSFPNWQEGSSMQGPSGCLHLHDVKDVDPSKRDSLPIEVIDFMNKAIDRLPHMSMEFAGESDYRRMQNKKPRTTNPKTKKKNTMKYRNVFYLADLCAASGR